MPAPRSICPGCEYFRRVEAHEVGVVYLRCDAMKDLPLQKTGPIVSCSNFEGKENDYIKAADGIDPRRAWQGVSLSGKASKKLDAIIAKGEARVVRLLPPGVESYSLERD